MCTPGICNPRALGLTSGRCGLRFHGSSRCLPGTGLPSSVIAGRPCVAWNGPQTAQRARILRHLRRLLSATAARSPASEQEPGATHEEDERQPFPGGP